MEAKVEDFVNYARKTTSVMRNSSLVMRDSNRPLC